MKKRSKKCLCSVQNGTLIIFVILFMSFGLVFGMNLVGMLPHTSEIEENEILTDNNDEIVPLDLNYVDSELAVSDTDDEFDLSSDEYVDVTDFGAVGDGTTDDYQSIMDAINYAVDNNIDTVYFPSKTFAIGDKLWMNSHYNGLTFRSDGGVIKIINENAERTFEFKADAQGDIEDITIKGLELDGNKRNLDVVRWDHWGILVWGDDSVARGIHIEDVVVHDYSGNGFYIDSSDTTINNCLSYNNWGHGFAVGGSAKNVHITNITAENNVSPDNPLYGSGLDVRGGDNIVVENFRLTGNGFGFKTSIYNPDVTLLDGIVEESNWAGMRIIQEGKNVYVDNVTTRYNGYEGIVVRHSGTVEFGRVHSYNDGRVEPQHGALYIADDIGEMNIENLKIENYPGHGIYSYTSNLIIQQLNITGCDGYNIYPIDGDVLLEPPELNGSCYIIEKPIDLETIEAHEDGVVLNGEKLKVQSQNGEIQVKPDVWTEEDRKYLASSTDTKIFEIEGLEPHSSYKIFKDGTLEKYVSTDSNGYLKFEYSDQGENEFNIKNANVNVVTLEPTDITTSSAVLNGEITDLGDQNELNAFFRYREVDDDVWIETEYQTFTNTAEYEEEITGLSSNTNYEYQAVIQWDNGENTGEIISFSTDFETESYDWEGFVDPLDEDVIYTEELPIDIVTLVDSVPDSDDGSGTSLDYYGEFYIDGNFVDEKSLNSEPDQTEFTYENMDEGTYVLRVEWHYDLGLIEADEINVTVEKVEPDFELSNLVVYPEDIYVGTEMTLEVDIENVGTSAGNYTAEFYIDDEIIGTDTVTVDLDHIKTASVKYNLTESGTFEISIEELTKEITVNDLQTPIINTVEVRDVTECSALLVGEVISFGDFDEGKAFFRLREKGQEEWIESDERQLVTNEGEFEECWSNLAPSKTYEFEAFLEFNSTVSGGVINFETTTGNLSVETLSASNITHVSSTLNGELLESNESDEVQIYFEYRKEGEKEWISTEPKTIDKICEFSKEIRGLEPNTHYEYRAVAEDEEKDTGEIAYFSTNSVLDRGKDEEEQKGSDFDLLYKGLLMVIGLNLIIGFGGIGLFSYIFKNSKPRKKIRFEEEFKEKAR